MTNTEKYEAEVAALRARVANHGAQVTALEAVENSLRYRELERLIVDRNRRDELKLFIRLVQRGRQFRGTVDDIIMGKEVA